MRIKATSVSGVRLHPAVFAAQLRDEKLGFLGFPNAVRTVDHDGRIRALLDDGPEAKIRTDGAQHTSNAIQELERAGVVDRRASADLGLRAALFDNYAAQLDLLSRPLITHFESFQQTVGYPSMEKIQVGVIGEGLLADELSSNLSSLSIEAVKIEHEKLESDMAVLVVAHDRTDRALAERWNIIARTQDTPFLFASASRYKATVGPYLPYHSAGCVRCFFRRQIINADFPEERVATENYDDETGFIAGAVLRKMAGCLAANQIAKIVLNLRHLVTPGEVIEFNALDSQLTYAALVPDPVCPICAGGISEMVPDSFYRSTVDL